MLQMELMHRQQQQQQIARPLGSSRIVMGGIIVDPDPSVDSPASSAAATLSSNCHDILCVGQCIGNFQVLYRDTVAYNIIVTTARAMSACQCRALRRPQQSTQLHFRHTPQ
jgi:hypothetical protein